MRDEEHVAQNVESDEDDNGDDDDDDEDGEWTERRAIDKATQRYIVGVIILL